MGVETVAPTFVKKPALRQEDDGNKLLFECEVSAWPQPEVEWFRGSEQLSAAGGRSTVVVRPAGGDSTWHVALELVDIEESDAGTYRVKARNSQGEVQASINLNFSAPNEEEPDKDGIAPQFAQKPRIKQTDDGNIRFECRVLADPAPTITWFHNDSTLSSGGRYSVSSDADGASYFCCLEISAVAMEDAGKYKVNAKNDLGESNATINLNFDSEAPPPGGQAKPAFIKKPAIKNLGSSIVMECVLTANPAPDITWLCGDNPVSLGGGKFAANMEELSDKDTYRATLEISNPQLEDGGQYKCRAKNDLGESHANIALNFAAPPEPEVKAPSFVSKPKIIPAPDGSKITMKCQVKCKPSPTAVWSHEGSTVAGGRYSQQIKDDGNDQYTLILELTDPEANDGGVYKCTAKNEHGESNANLTLNFAAPPEPPKKDGVAPNFVEKPKIIPKDGGKLIVLECKVNAQPEPTAAWSRDGTAVTAGGRISMDQKKDGDNYTFQLLIKDPTLEDGGIYKCTAKNELGESNANLNLNLQGEKKPEGVKPQFTEKPQIRQDSTGRNVTVECRLRAKPQATITWYKGTELVRSGGGGGRYSMSLKEVDAENYIVLFEIENVIEGDTAKYKCNAKNELGETNANINLNFEGAPKEPPPKYDRTNIKSKIKQKTLIIEFRIITNTKPHTYTFFKETTEISAGPRHKIDVRKDSDSYIIVMEIENVTPQDKGKYKVIAKNEFGQCEGTTPVEIPDELLEDEGPKEAPKFTQKLQPKDAAAGKTIELKCKSNVPADSVSWYRNNTKITKTKNYTMIQENEVYILRILEAQPADAGTYKCEVSNPKGKDTCTAPLTVEEGKEKKDEDDEKDTIEKAKKEEEEKKKKEAEKKKKEAEEKKKKEEEEKKKKAEEEKKKKAAEDKKKADEAAKKKADEEAAKKKKADEDAKKKAADEAAKKKADEDAKKKAADEAAAKKKADEEDAKKKSADDAAAKKKAADDAAAKKKPADADKKNEEANEAKPKEEENRPQETKPESKMSEEKPKQTEEKPQATEKKTPGDEKAKKAEEKPKQAADKDKKVEGKPSEDKKTNAAKPEEKKEEVTKFGLKKTKKGPTREKAPPKQMADDFTRLKLRKSSTVKRDIDGAELEEVGLKGFDKPKKKGEKAEKTKAKEVEPDNWEMAKLGKRDDVKLMEADEIEFNRTKREKPVLNDVGAKEAADKTAAPGAEEGKKRVPSKKKKEEAPEGEKRKLVMGKGKLPGDEPEPESVSLKPVPDKGTAVDNDAGDRKLSVTETKMGRDGGRDSLPDGYEAEGPKRMAKKDSLAIPDIKTPDNQERKTSVGRRGSIIPPGRKKSVADRKVMEARQRYVDEPDKSQKLQPKGPAGTPPSFVEPPKNITAPEKQAVEETVIVAGNPAPTVHWFKDFLDIKDTAGTEILEGGRYRFYLESKTNEATLQVRKCTHKDDGVYSCKLVNPHGEVEEKFKIFVRGEKDVDFRAMLKHSEYDEWGRDPNDPNWGKLKPKEQERRDSKVEVPKVQLKKAQRRGRGAGDADERWLREVENLTVKEGRHDKAKFVCTFSLPNLKGQWFKYKNEIFPGRHYHLSQDADTYTLIIKKPTVDDAGKYRCVVNKQETEGWLEVDEADPKFYWMRLLQRRIDADQFKTALLECTASDKRAKVKWYHKDKLIEVLPRQAE